MTDNEEETDLSDCMGIDLSKTSCFGGCRLVGDWILHADIDVDVGTVKRTA